MNVLLLHYILFRLSQMISYNVFEKKSNYKLLNNMFKFFRILLVFKKINNNKHFV